jgi:drug/metabolite transporter (DMT)-like permease
LTKFRIDYVALIASTICWGFAGPLSDIAVEYFTPSALTAIQTFSGLVFIIAVLSIKGHKLRVPWRLALLLGFLEPAMSFYFGNLGFERGSVAIGAVILGTEPLFVAVLGVILLKEKLNKIEVGAVILGFAGAVIGSEPWGGKLEIDTLGIIFFFIAALFSGLYVITMHRMGEYVDILSLALGQIFVSTTISTIIYLSSPGKSQPIAFEFTYLLTAVLAGIFGIGLAFMLFNFAAKTIKAAYLGIALNFNLVVTFFAAWLLGRGAPGLAQYIGAILIIVSLQVLREKEPS